MLLLAFLPKPFPSSSFGSYSSSAVRTVRSVRPALSEDYDLSSRFLTIEAVHPQLIATRGLQASVSIELVLSSAVCHFYASFNDSEKDTII